MDHEKIALGLAATAAILLASCFGTSGKVSFTSESVEKAFLVRLSCLSHNLFLKKASTPGLRDSRALAFNNGGGSGSTGLRVGPLRECDWYQIMNDEDEDGLVQDKTTGLSICFYFSLSSSSSGTGTASPADIDSSSVGEAAAVETDPVDSAGSVAGANDGSGALSFNNGGNTGFALQTIDGIAQASSTAGVTDSSFGTGVIAASLGDGSATFAP